MINSYVPTSEADSQPAALICVVYLCFCLCVCVFVAVYSCLKQIVDCGSWPELLLLHWFHSTKPYLLPLTAQLVQYSTLYNWKLKWLKVRKCLLICSFLWLVLLLWTHNTRSSSIRVGIFDLAIYSWMEEQKMLQFTTLDDPKDKVQKEKKKGNKCS